MHSEQIFHLVFQLFEDLDDSNQFGEVHLFINHNVLMDEIVQFN